MKSNASDVSENIFTFSAIDKGCKSIRQQFGYLSFIYRLLPHFEDNEKPKGLVLILYATPQCDHKRDRCRFQRELIKKFLNILFLTKASTQ